MLSLACSGYPSPPSVQTGSVGGSSGEGGECSGGQTGINREPPVFIVEPTLKPNDNDAAPLAAMLEVETNVATNGTVLISGGGESWSVSLDFAPVHQQALLGFKPDTDYTLTVTVDAGDSEISAEPLIWHTPALPTDFPHLSFVRSDPTRMAAGMTLFDVIVERYAVVVDNGGQVRWYYRSPRLNARYRLLANGNIACVSSYGSYLAEIDWFGNAVNLWYAANSGAPPVGTIPVAVDNFHHNIDEMPNGNLVVLSEEERMIDKYPTSADNPAAPTAKAWVTGDQVVEFTRRGEIAKRYSLFDIIDPTRIGRDGESKDWSHSNAVVYDSASDAYLVSMRHQDAVIKFRRQTGELVWILGDHANWRAPWKSKLLTALGDDFQWQYHQHAVELTPGGVGLYDNGNYGAPAYQDPNPPYYSRAVRFVIDEEAMTVEQLWTYHPHVANSRLFSYAMSDNDLLPNGNALIASGTISSQRPQPGWAQIVEVTDEGETVFELNVLDSPQDLTMFDADRIPDLRYINSNHSVGLW